MKEKKFKIKIKIIPWIFWGYKNPKKHNWEIKNIETIIPSSPQLTPTPPKKKTKKEKKEKSHLAHSHVFD